MSPVGLLLIDSDRVYTCWICRVFTAYVSPLRHFRVFPRMDKDSFIDTNAVSPRSAMRTDISPGRTSKTWQGFSPLDILPSRHVCVCLFHLFVSLFICYFICVTVYVLLFKLIHFTLRQTFLINIFLNFLKFTYYLIN